MPEMTFDVRWPDGRVEQCYSPSLVMWDHLEPGSAYTVGEFARRSTYALELASDRVRAKFGHACTSATASTQQIQQSASAYADDDVVEVVRMHPPVRRPSAQES